MERERGKSEMLCTIVTGLDGNGGRVKVQGRSEEKDDTGALS